ncbi:MAG: HAD family phosphatase [Burkholderiaceae bacterium]|nr:HAD family phosphatase [Burkholderiaceae bacterium]
MTVVWDFGGVLFRWDPAALIARTLPHRITTQLDARHWKEQFFLSYRGEWGEYDRGVTTVADMVPRIAQRTGLTEREVQAVVDAVPDELQPITDSVRLLTALRERGHRLHYLSNMPAPLAAHLQRRHDFLSLFASGIYSSHVQLTKPDPAIFTLAQQRFGGDPADTLFIDDHPENIEAARRHGWQAQLFTGAQALAVELRALALIA